MNYKTAVFSENLQYSKKISIIHLIKTYLEFREVESDMNSKKKKIFSAVIVVILVIAMVLPMVARFLV